jgi:hypothetical protein
VLRIFASVALALVLAACGVSPSGSSAASRSPAALVTPGASPTEAPRTLPPGVAFVHDGVLAPGTYWFRGFEPWVQVEVDDSGWEVGHFHDEIFDLFHAGDFPAIGFARFPSVATPASSATPAGGTVPATSIDAILDAWRSNPAIEVVDLGPATIAGLSGRSVEVAVSAEQTPLFGAGGEGFKFDPGFDSRFHLLEVDGGVLEVFIVGQAGELEAAIAGTRPILESLQIVE